MIFDHTYNNQAPPAEGVFAVRLSGTTTDGQTKEKIGLIRSLSVMPGDKITVEVYAKYVDLSNSSLNSSVRSLVTSIASGTASAGTVIDGNHYGTSDASAFPYGGDLANEKALDTRGGPKAYLNYLVFDKDFNFISSKSDYKKVTTDAAEDGSTITLLNPDGKSHQQLTASIDITEAGYVYIYLSNEEETPTEVYFDDFKVTQVKSPVIASNDYYPFGLTFNSYSRENSIKQDYQYNGKEMQDELHLGWLDYGARMYMPEIGRWGVVDGLVDEYESWSPYTYALNRPNINLDYDGYKVTDPIKCLVVPNNPNEVDPQVWKPNPNYKAPGSLQWVDKNGNKLTFDKGRPELNQYWQKQDHWHYEDANKNRYNKDGKISRAYSHDEAHLLPGEETKIELNKSPNSMLTRNKFRGGSRGKLLGTSGLTLSYAMFALDLYKSYTGDPHSIGMQFTEGFSDNKLYYNEKTDQYWERTSKQDIKNESGDVIGVKYSYDIYSGYTYDKEQGKYIGVNKTATVQGVKYEGQEAQEYFKSLLNNHGG